MHLIKSYDLSENEFIYELACSDNNTKLNVIIVCDDGTSLNLLVHNEAFLLVFGNKHAMYLF